MPAKDINVRRETSRRCYRNSIAKNKDMQIKRQDEFERKASSLKEIRNRVIAESLGGWVSPERIKKICKEYEFKLSSPEEVARKALYWWSLGGCLEAGAFNKQTPFMRDDKDVYEYFKKRAPKTQRSAGKAEILILSTMIRFMKKGYSVSVFDERYS